MVWTRGAAVLTVLATMVAAVAARQPALDAAAPLDVRVSPRHGLAPADVDVSVLVEPSDDNRAVTVTIESKTFLRASTIELEGRAAPRASEFRFRALPAGDYEISVHLFDSRQHERGWAHRVVSLS
jgi:hypothetical protein